MPTFINIAGYKFAPLSRLHDLRGELIRDCRSWDLKGTILISPEGINLFTAGLKPGIDQLLARLRALPGLEDLEVKFSESDHQPFNRMLVRVKKEIIAFGVPGIDPSRRTSPKLKPAQLKEWLDSGRPVTLLDTRNDYEVKLGTFENARAIGIDHFRDFPSAVEKLPRELKEQPVVMFCTGGIRCEKAGPFMEKAGFKNIFQLEGGILKYFEECGSAHYSGECFVFDQRVGVDPHLRETDSAQCFKCLAPLTKKDQADPRYVPNRSCPACYRTPEEEASTRLARRREAFRAASTPLPGRAPYDNLRPINVPTDCDGLTLAAFLEKLFPHLPREMWEAAEQSHALLDPEKTPTTLNRIVRTGERYWRLLEKVTEPDVNASVDILHEDEALIVLNKPAPLPIHAGGRYNRNTLQYLVHKVYYPERPHPAHRLDANTSGVLILTRKRQFASILQPQFARGEVEKFYLALVHGRPSSREFECAAPISAEPGELGSRRVDWDSGLPARTAFRVLEEFPSGQTLLEARPLSGRTNQIRVHLWELGFPIVGDQVYVAEKRLGDTQTLAPTDPPLCLHAWRIRIQHPLTGELAEFSAPLPDWARRPQLK